MREDLKPSTKVAYAGAVGTPVAVLAVWVAGLFGVAMPAEVGAAIGALLAAAVAYVKR